MKKAEYEKLGWTKTNGRSLIKGNIKVYTNGNNIKVFIDGKEIENNYKTLTEALTKL